MGSPPKKPLFRKVTLTHMSALSGLLLLIMCNAVVPGGPNQGLEFHCDMHCAHPSKNHDLCAKDFTI